MSSAKDLFKGTPKQQSCPICFLDFTVLKQLSCFHFICEACLDKIKSKAGSEAKPPKCPFCSATIEGNATNWFAGDLTCHECLESKDCRDIWWCQTCVRLICSFCQIKVHQKTGHETKELQDSGQLRSTLNFYSKMIISERVNALKKKIRDKFLSIYQPLIDKMAVELMSELQLDLEKEKKIIEDKLAFPVSSGWNILDEKWDPVKNQLLSFFGCPGIQTENEFIKASMKKITVKSIQSKLQVVVPKPEKDPFSLLTPPQETRLFSVPQLPPGIHAANHGTSRGKSSAWKIPPVKTTPDQKDSGSFKNTVISSQPFVATKRRSEPNIGGKRSRSGKITALPARSSSSSESSEEEVSITRVAGSSTSGLWPFLPQVYPQADSEMFLQALAGKSSGLQLNSLSSSGNNLPKTNP